LRSEREIACPLAVQGTVFRGGWLSDGYAIEFRSSTPGGELRVEHRARELERMFNEVYGPGGEERFLAETILTADGATRVEFKPLSRTKGATRRALSSEVRQLVGSHVPFMQSGHPCHMMQHLMLRGARPPSLQLFAEVLSVSVD
jgi:hypothetical protein